jgi:D-alanyl-D-alanine carboxypeptidase
MRLAVAAAALLLQGGCADRIATRQPMSGTEFSRKLGACFEAQAARLAFSGVVLVERGGSEFFAALGFADAHGRVPMRRGTRFRLASVTKIITRAAIGRLVEEGRITLESPVGDFVAGLPAEMAEVTVEQLLRHRAGIVPLRQMEPDDPDYLRLMGARRATDALPVLVKNPLRFRPGEREEYSNGGFILLGVLIEAVTGKDYGAYVEEAVFRPLRMTSSSLRADRRTAVPMTIVDMPDKTRPVPAPHSDRTGLPSGDSVSSADDLARLGRALIGDRFLSPAVRARVFPRELPFATIFQDGATSGVETVFIADADSRTVFVLLGNRDLSAAEPLGRALLGAIGMIPDTSCGGAAAPR